MACQVYWVIAPFLTANSCHSTSAKWGQWLVSRPRRDGCGRRGALAAGFRRLLENGQVFDAQRKRPQPAAQNAAGENNSTMRAAR
jgi:hypothetical protein